MVKQATVDTALFNGDVIANRQSGAAFLLERRLSAISNSIPPGSPLTITDHRIPSAQMPLLDLRVPGKTPGPQFYPVSAIDYCTGYLMAFGAMVALARRTQEDPDTKPCPECSSSIPINARRCPLCTSELAPAAGEA